MQTVRSGFRSLSLIYDLGFDRIAAPVLILAGLGLAAHLVLGMAVFNTPGTAF